MNPANFDSADIDWASVESEWQLEPELRNAPPRRLVSRAPKIGCGARIGNGVLGCALSGIFILGFFLSLWAGLALLILPFGRTTQGVITAHERTQQRLPSYGLSDTYTLSFEFRPRGGGAIYRGEWPAKTEAFLRLRDGDSAEVRYFPPFPGLRPTLTKGVSPWLHVWFLGPLGLLLLAIGGLPMLGLLPWGQTEKRLVKRGVVAPALITERGNGNTVFCFRVSNAQGETRTIESTQLLTSRDWELAPSGAVATVLFDKNRPTRAVIYRLCDWRAR